MIPNSKQGALREQLLEVIGRDGAAPLDDQGFDQLAREIFACQFENGAIYRAFCERRGVTPAAVESWLDIPAVPTDAFKAAPLISGGTPSGAEVVFRTSGTTAGSATRGTHYLLESSLYRAALLESFRVNMLPDRDRIRVLSLVADRKEVVDSSLSFMMTEVVEALGAEGSRSFVSPAGADISGMREALREAEREHEPVLIAGASFAFVHLLDALAETGEHFRLPAGSRVMDTGGFKGRSRVVPREELYQSITDRLGVGSSYIVNEYGMTEMSSQFYDGVAGSAGPAGGGRLHRGPGWVRSAAVDPETLCPLPAGQVGVLRHMDLANLYSIASLQTADMGVVHPDGEIEIFGRAVGADERGCSIAVDELLEVMGRR
ncbi:MAG: long-chain fatty acid--CoA ligase [Gemmatimonadota bacterium]|jgi:hypothetical protein|nr:long-chain fatty acid--CoA ligase [Gemmatimonadota bacterium]